MVKPTTTTRIDHKRGVELLTLGGRGRMQIEPLDDRPMGLQGRRRRYQAVMRRQSGLPSAWRGRADRRGSTARDADHDDAVLATHLI
jgi:hypothetical protein